MQLEDGWAPFTAVTNVIEATVICRATNVYVTGIWIVKAIGHSRGLSKVLVLLQIEVKTFSLNIETCQAHSAIAAVTVDAVHQPRRVIIDGQRHQYGVMASVF